MKIYELTITRESLGLREKRSEIDSKLSRLEKSKTEPIGIFFITLFDTNNVSLSLSKLNRTFLAMKVYGVKKLKQGKRKKVKKTCKTKSEAKARALGWASNKNGSVGDCKSNMRGGSRKMGSC